MRPTMRHLFSAALAGLLVLAFHTPASAQAVIRLRNGRYVLAKIDMQTPPDEDGLVLQRLDNGGRLELQWSDLATEYADKLREEYHLVDGNEKEKATIEATRVVWTEGGRRHELVGIETGRDTEYLYIKRQKNTWKVRIQDLRGVPESVVAPMVDVLTPQEIYERKRAEIAPEKDAKEPAEPKVVTTLRFRAANLPGVKVGDAIRVCHFYRLTESRTDLGYGWRYHPLTYNSKGEPVGYPGVRQRMQDYDIGLAGMAKVVRLDGETGYAELVNLTTDYKPKVDDMVTAAAPQGRLWYSSAGLAGSQGQE